MYFSSLTRVELAAVSVGSILPQIGSLVCAIICFFCFIVATPTSSTDKDITITYNLRTTSKIVKTLV